MMHSHNIKADGETFTCNVNGDFSGDVHIYVGTDRVEWHPPQPEIGVDASAEVCIPFEVLKELVGRSVMAEITARMEQLTGAQLIDEVAL